VNADSPELSFDRSNTTINQMKAAQTNKVHHEWLNLRCRSTLGHGNMIPYHKRGNLLIAGALFVTMRFFDGQFSKPGKWLSRIGTLDEKSTRRPLNFF